MTTFLRGLIATLKYMTNPGTSTSVATNGDYEAVGTKPKRQTIEAQNLVEEITRRYPAATLMNTIYLPAIRAAGELQRGNAERAIELLEVVTPYEGGAWLWPPYLRGQAYLRLKQGRVAAAEFQKILDHRGWDLGSTFYPLATLGLARAAALNGDAVNARKAYQDFFALWKGADADLPILSEATKEYERLK